MQTNDFPLTKKKHKHKQIWGIGLGLGRWQIFVYAVFGGHSLWGRKTHKQIPRKNPGIIPWKNCVSVFVSSFLFSLPKISGKSHPWTNTSVGGNFRRTFRTIGPYEFPQEKVWTNDWSIRISPEMCMDQWSWKFSESFSLDRYWSIECSSLNLQWANGHGPLRDTGWCPLLPPETGYHCFPNKYRTGTIILAIIFRLQVQIPNFSGLIIITATVFPGNRIN